MAVALQVEDLGKRYRLGEYALGGRLSERLEARIRGRANGGGRERQEAFWAVRHVSFDVESGQCVGLIGRNGTGKTTVLKLLAKVTPPTEGRITRFGRTATLLEVGTGFHPELTGRENIYLSGTIMGMRAAEVAAEFDAIVAFSGIERFLDTPVKRFSSGMYVRLAFAVAAHLQAEIMLIDEVLAVGDAQFQQACLAKLREMAREGRTVLFVSHDMDAVRQLCDRVLVFADGGIDLDAAPPAAVAHYLRPPVAARRGDGAVRIADVTVVNLDQLPVSRLATGEPFTVVAALEVHQDRDVAIEVTITGPGGSPLLSAASDDGGGGPMHLRPGRIDARVELRAVLAPGAYGVDVVVRGSHGEEIARTDMALRFSVAVDPSRAAVAPAANWEIRAARDPGP